MAKVDYKAILDEAWQQHLAPRETDAPTVISMFAGCGGSSLGYSMAGFRELLAVEWDDNAVETFKLNFPEIPVYHGDITKLSVEKCCEMAGVQPSELDILDGSPPCQGFSTAGKRNLDDDRNQLFREFVRLLRGLKPKAFIMENVSGMVKGKMKLVFAECLRELKASGYRVKAWLLNAMYFNVPQSRQRMIFMGVRNGTSGEPSHPQSHRYLISASEAVQDVTNRMFRIRLATVATAIWNCIQPGDNGTKYRNGYYSNTCKVHPDRPFPTIIKVASGTGGHMHWAERRTLTIDELKRGQSFPDAMQFVGKFDHQWEQIGNSVPPLFMRAIARHVRTMILERMTQLGCQCEVQ